MPLTRFSVVLIWLMLAGSAAAQSGSADVTFQVPLHVTNLASEITKVRVTCRLEAGTALPLARTGEVEQPVAGGQVATTVQVVVLVPSSALSASAAGSRQSYACTLSGYSPALGWNQFGFGATAPFRVALQSGELRNGPVGLEGHFTW